MIIMASWWVVTMIFVFIFCVDSSISSSSSSSISNIKTSIKRIKLVEEYTLHSQPEQMLDFNPHLILSDASENALFYDNPAICSGLSLLDGDRAFLGTSDDGPKEDCSNIDNGAWKPMPLYSAFATKFHLDENPSINKDGIKIGDIIIDERYIYLSLPGQKILSLQPPKQFTSFYGNINSLELLECDVNSELDIDKIFNEIDPGSARDDAIDMEEIIYIKNKNMYIGCEEYGPSLVVFNDAFQVKMRYFPIGYANNYDTSYAKKEIFPKVIGDRLRERRGFESIAYNKKDETLIVVFQSPLNLGGAAKQNAPFLRIYMVDISNIDNDDNDINVIGLYLYPLQNIQRWKEITGNENYNFRDTLVSAADFINNDKYFIVERGSGGILGNIANFKHATNCINIPEAITSNTDNMLESMSIDEIKNNLGITFLDVTLIIDYRIENGLHSSKIEGAQWIDDNTIVICNDGDFEEETKIQVLHYDRD